ncbi:leucine rich repeat domain-containing protein [Ditylenchus destructor]|nr:leucine rich repeat domain-containing protein [Ditylenchus destructor]
MKLRTIIFIPLLAGLAFADQCEEIDSIFLNVSDAVKQPACRCFLNQPASGLTEENKYEESVWIGCSGKSMPKVFRALNSLNETAVSKLLIWDSLMNILPAGMFSKILPESLDVSASSVSVFRKGALSKIGSRLKHLKLNKNIMKSIDKAIFQETLSKLQTLNLAGNQLMNINSHTFSGLTSLRMLDLSDNTIEKIEKNAFVGLENLEILHLGNNNVTIIDSSAFGGLKNLRLLDLGSNALLKLEIKNMPNLRTLLLNNNHIISMRDVLSGLPNLEALVLDRNSIENIGSEDLQGLRESPKLNSLSLVKNKLFKIESGAFVGLTSLTTLSLQDNQLAILRGSENSDISLLYPLTNLRHLFLSQNKLRRITDDLAGLTNLETLALDYNQLDQLDAEALKDMKLSKLFLNSNKLYYLPKGLFQYIDKTKLQAIDVSDNKWECICNQEWLGEWLKSVGDANMGDFPCLLKKCENGTMIISPSILTSISASWQLYLAVLITIVTLLSLVAIACLMVQENRRNYMFFTGAGGLTSLRRTPSDMVRLIPDLSFPNPVVSILSKDCAKSGKGSTTSTPPPEPPIIRPEGTERKRVRFNGV